MPAGQRPLVLRRESVSFGLQKEEAGGASKDHVVFRPNHSPFPITRFTHPRRFGVPLISSMTQPADCAVRAVRMCDVEVPPTVAWKEVCHSICLCRLCVTPGPESSGGTRKQVRVHVDRSELNQGGVWHDA